MKNDISQIPFPLYTLKNAIFGCYSPKKCPMPYHSKNIRLLLFFYWHFVSIIKTNETQSTPGKTVTAKKKYLKDDLPNQCGKRLVAKSTSMVQQRIASGFNTERGDHPWQVGEKNYTWIKVRDWNLLILSAPFRFWFFNKKMFFVNIGTNCISGGLIFYTLQSHPKNWNHQLYILDNCKKCFINLIPVFIYFKIMVLIGFQFSISKI